MTFTEAAVEVLRRAGKPLHYREIAEAAVRENLLSHVGQDPEVTMGQRLAAMAKREEDRKVVAVAPEGSFALTEWNVPAEAVIEAKTPSAVPDGAEEEKPYRGREREPRPINAQARRRMEALAGHEAEEPPLPGEQGRRDRSGQRRFPPPAEVLFEALAQRQSGAPLAELGEQLLAKGLLSEALVRDLPSLTAALLEDNRRRTEAGRKPAFIVDGERVTLVEFPQPSALGDAEKERAPQTSLGRPPAAAALVGEFRRATLRALRRRVADLETAGFELVCAALLEKMGLRDLRVAKRSKEGPLYLARQRRGLSDLRVAVRLVRGQREVGRQDVQELRKDLAHYSAQMGLVLAPGEAGREARAEASSAGQAPVALYVGEALAEELVAVRVGVSVQTVELADVDEAFFAAAAKAAPTHRGPATQPDGERRERPPRERPFGENGHPSPARLAPDGFREQAPAGADTASERAEGPIQSDSVAAALSVASESGREPGEEQSAEAAPLPAAPTEGEPEGTESDRSRRRGRGGREREAQPQRMASASDQAWGQPAGTPRRPLAQAPWRVGAEPREETPAKTVTDPEGAPPFEHPESGSLREAAKDPSSEADPDEE
jgi:ribonuclease E